MSKRLRMLVALATVAAMMLSLAGIASAQFDDVDEDAAYADAVELLYDLGITTGISDTEFGPDQPLTRQQFAVFVTRAQKQAALADSFANWRTNFSDDADIAPWARGAVYLASSSGIINGYPDGTFRPTNPVTVAEALTMLVRALGFKTYAESKGGFPAGYLIAAQELGLDDGLSLTAANLPMQRWEMAVALANALETPRTKNEDGSPDPDAAGAQDSKWIAFFDSPRAQYYEGIVEDVSAWNERITVGSRTFDFDNQTVVDVNGKAPAPAIPVDDDLEDKLVRVYYDGKYAKRIDIVADTLAPAALLAVDAEAGTVTVDADVDGDGDLDGDFEVKVSRSTEITLDGKKVSLADLEEALADFQDEWDDKPGVVTVRVAAVEEAEDVAGDGSDQAAGLAVILDNIIEGKVSRTGTDRDGTYAIINGKRVHYEFIDGTTDTPTGEVVWLLDADGVARVALSEVSAATKFFAIVNEYYTEDDDDVVVFELADGSTRTISKWQAPADFDDAKNSVGKVVFVDVNSSGAAAVTAYDDLAGSALELDDDGVVNAVTSTYITVDNMARPVASGGVIVRDATATGSTHKFVSYSTIKKDYKVKVYGDAGIVHYIEITQK